MTPHIRRSADASLVSGKDAGQYGRGLERGPKFQLLTPRGHHLPTATLGFVRRPGDAVSEFDGAANGAKRLEAFAGAKDRHIAIVEHAPED
jgi:hypothetical protein